MIVKNDIIERGRLVKEQSWVPGMGVAFCECCQLYGARCGLESPCSWGRPLSLIFPRIGNKPAWYPCGLIFVACL